MNTTPQAHSREQRHVCRYLLCRLIVLCVAFALSGCAMAQGDSLPTPNIVQPTSTGTNLSFTTITQGKNLSANLFVDKPSIIVISSAQEVDAALRQAAGDPPKLAMNPHPINQARQIDYSRSFAILVLQGKQATAGYGITIQQIAREDHRVRVLATFVSPAPGDAVSETGTDPYHLVAVPKEGTWAQDVRFELVDNGKVVAEAMHFIP